MDTGTWNRLTQDEQSEVRSLNKRFTRALRHSRVTDGTEFGQLYSVAEVEGRFFLSDDGKPFAGITSASRNVMEALLTDALQNYGR